MKKKKYRLKKKYDILFTKIIVTILLITLMFSTFKIYEYLNNNKKIKSIEENILNNVEIEEIKIDEFDVEEPTDYDKDSLYWKYKKVSMIDVNISSLKEENNDTVGWIQVEGTNINYPVVKANDNEYYLTHDFLKNNNRAGWIFLDYRNDLDNLKENTIIYGHKMKDSTMFGTLSNLLQKEWLNNEDNHIIKVASISNSYLFQIFSIYVVEDETYYIKSEFNEESSFNEFINTIKNRSIHNFKAKINNNDKILTLSTCYGKEKRLVVHAKLIRTIKKDS